MTRAIISKLCYRSAFALPKYHFTHVWISGRVPKRKLLLTEKL